MIWTVLPLATGIVIARYLDIPMWVSVFCFLVTLVTAWLSLGRRIAGLNVVLSLFFAGILLMATNRPVHILPTGGKLDMQLRLTQEPVLSSRWCRADAEVTLFKEGGQWRTAGEKVIVYIDSSYSVKAFHNLTCRAYVNPLDTTGSSYGNLMEVRGFFNRIYLTAGTINHVDLTPVKSLKYYAAAMQAGAVRRLSKLNLPTKEADVVRTMVAGDKRGLDPSLRSSYSTTGAAHLLAVSGLHVGIVFVMINILLMPLAIVGRGHIWKNILAVLVIFAYAIMTGMSPSVMRAALMFSFAQVALATSLGRNSLNIMLASALVLLVINPNYLFDISFQLSYAAVLSIIMFYGPLYRLVRTRYRLINAFTGVMIVGLAAGVGTAPLVAYYFGNFPLVGILINPMVIFTAHVIVMAGVVWVVAPIPFLKPIIAWFAGKAALVQNIVVEWSSGLSWAALKIEMPLWGVFLCYGMIVGFALWFYRLRHDKGERPQSNKLRENL